MKTHLTRPQIPVLIRAANLALAAVLFSCTVGPTPTLTSAPTDTLVAGPTSTSPRLPAQENVPSPMVERTVTEETPSISRPCVLHGVGHGPEASTPEQTCTDIWAWNGEAFILAAVIDE